MSTQRHIKSFTATCNALPLLAVYALLTSGACVQTAQSQVNMSANGEALEVIDGLRTGAFGPATEQQVDDARSGQLISILEARFADGHDVQMKSRIASALVKLGDRNDTYWNFLVEQATPAAQSDAPDPKCLVPTGRSGQGSSPEYAAWAKSHNILPGSPEEKSLLELPLKLEVLASTGDPRGLPLLRQALRSPNFEIESVAAEGLAEVHDRGSIPLIIEACKKAPAEVAPSIARYLDRFDDPQAQAAAKAYLPKVPDELDELRQGNMAPVFLEKVAAAREVQAVPILAEQFARTGDDVTKAHIASSLVRLGDNDSRYWDFLVEQARLAIESDAPSVTKWDAQGRIQPGTSPEFVAWTKVHNIPANSAKEDAMVWFPQRVLFLGLTGDPRGIPLLRRGLLSSNYMVQTYAAMGLAKLEDDDSIPLIIEACNRAPSEVSSSIAESLVYFDAPDAQNAVDKYMTKDAARALREARANGKTPFH